MSIISQSWIKKNVWNRFYVKCYHTHKYTHTKEGGKEEIIRGDGIVYGDNFTDVYLAPIYQVVYMNTYSFSVCQSYFSKKGNKKIQRE